jgi:plastocyanin
MRRRQILAAAVAIPLVPLLAVRPAFAAEHAVTIKGMKFDPAEITVAAGDTITFTNEDGAPHTATADDGAFDTGRLNKGESATVTVSAAGAHPYKCLVHPSMKGTVTAN